MSDFLLIEDANTLTQVCRELKGSPWVAVDTEFMREQTYYPRLCLLQFATDELTACIDPLALDTLEPCFELLFEQTTVKVFHAARQDLEIFYHLTESVPAPVFDTQVAASFIGLGEQSGYGAVVEALLGTKLDKSHARTDWLRRPLPPAALRYAADDVRYLTKVFRHLEDRLRALGRLEWARTEMTHLTEPSTYRPTPVTAWRRVRGTKRLKRAALSRVQALAAWREETAMATDRPRQWILRDDVLVEAARRMPTTNAQLAALRGIKPGAVKRWGAAILKALVAAPEAPPTDVGFAAPLGPAQDAALDLLMAVTRLRSAEQRISLKQLATRAELKQLVRGERDLDVLTGWRKEAIGEELLALLAGEISLRVVGGRAILAKSMERRAD